MFVETSEHQICSQQSEAAALQHCIKSNLCFLILNIENLTRLNITFCTSQQVYSKTSLVEVY
jgi:hypothetical protein